jgi:hypothetical protein
MKTLPRILGAFSVVAFAAIARAQDNPIIPGDPQNPGVRYNVQNMNFDMWCQEQQHLPALRCDKRLPEDDAAFNAYRSKIERYEIPHLQQQQHEIQLDRGILHNDPVDRPTEPSQAQAPPVTESPPPQ